jgi:PKD repeat protein
LLRSILIYTILLLGISCRRNIVDPTVTVDFTYEVVSNDYSVPVRIAIVNNTSGAQFYQWTFEGGNPATYDRRDPGYVVFENPGAIKIKLEAWSNEDRDEKGVTILLDSVVDAGFTATPVINNYGVTEFALTNASLGVTKYNWTFEKGAPAVSTEKNPKVTFKDPGTYRIFLQVQNERGEKDTVSKSVTVLAALAANFEIEPSFDDDDLEAPLLATLQNLTTHATIHKWSVAGGELSSATDSIPMVRLANPGTYTISYVASNGKQTDTIRKTITVKPNSGLRSFTNIKLGINSAHSTIGSFFSTRLRRVFTLEQVTATNADKIDIIYFGLSQSFNFNLFASPDSAQVWTFDAIPGATHTKIINKQESCGCGTSFSETAFNNATTGAAFQSINIIESAAGGANFSDAMVPRVVLFQNAAGKKGAIKVKQFIADGLQSYILCDIKVQKE